MKNTYAFIAGIFLLMLASGVQATSFIAECSDDAWRAEQADVIIEGTVVSSDPYSFQGETHTKTLFSIDQIIAGTYAEKTIVVDHIGNSDTGSVAISITIDYIPGERYRLELQHNEENPGTYSAICGEMGVMKLETPPENIVTVEEPSVSLWTRIKLFFQNFFGN